MERIPPALAAVATQRIRELGPPPATRFEVVIAPVGADLTGIDAERVLHVQRDGSVVG